ncbi:MAG: AraC family transcriptional regulator [Acidobacteriota bacterium]
MCRNRHIAFDQDTYQRLCRARSFIDRNFCQPINLDQVSGQACFSRYHFIRLFRQTFNKTPHQYITQKRIEKAKALLTSSKLTVTDVCFEVGFESLGSFSSLFRKYVGDSPITYRTRNLKPFEIPEKVQHMPIPACFLIKFGIAG